MDKKNDFYSDIDEIKKEYKTNPDKVSKYTHDTIIKIRRSNGNRKEMTEDNKYTLFSFLLIVALGLLGILNVVSGSIEFVVLYYSGLGFFAAGYFIGASGEKMTLIFLFAHGLVGFCLMNVPVVTSVLQNPILTDGGTIVYIYLVITLIIAIFAFLYQSFMVFAGKYSNGKYMVFHTLVPYVVVTILVQILPYILNFLLTI